MPFAVSLTLIFGYSLLQVAVPPTVLGTESLASVADEALDASHAVERVQKAHHAEMRSRDDDKPSIH